MASCYNGGDWEWPQRSEVFSVYILLGRGGLRDSGQIQGIPEAVLSPTLPVILSKLLWGRDGMFLSQRKLLYNTV